MAIRTGWAQPFGSVLDDFDMSDFTTGQVPLFVEIGGKPIRELFVGGYLGLGFGAAAGQLSDTCDQANLDCMSVSTRIGVEVQWHILPHADFNPWVGYGIGLESSSMYVAQGDEDGNYSMAGFELARLSAGVDYRISRVFGIGPFVDFSLGKYYSYRIDAPAFPDTEGDIDDTAFHEWLTIGARFVFFP